MATEVLDGSRRFDVVVRFPDAMRGNPEAIAGAAADGAGRRAGAARQRGQRRAWCAAPRPSTTRTASAGWSCRPTSAGRDVGSFVAEAQQRLEGRGDAARGATTWRGAASSRTSSAPCARLALVIPLSLAIIFLLLFVTFGNVRQAGLVILNVPFALVGGIGALWLRGLNLNLSASVGFIALFGVAVLNGVVMIAAVNRLREDGRGRARGDPRRAPARGSSRC